MGARTTVAEVRVPARGLRQDLRAVKVVCLRELLRFKQDRTRAITALIQPLLFLFVLGSGLSRLVPSSGNVNFRTFLFPGVLATSMLFSALFSGISIVWDREFGFLREMLVAPVRRGAIVLGKCVGGALITTAQTLIVLLLGPLVGVPYRPLMILGLIGMLLLVSFTITALGLVLGARIKRVQAVMGLSQLVLAPMMFLSGALFPLANLPGWLHVLTALNPLTYAVEPMRSLVFGPLDIDPATRAALAPGLRWFGWHVPVLLQVGMIAALGAGLLAVAAAQFSKAE